MGRRTSLKTVGCLLALFFVLLGFFLAVVLPGKTTGANQRKIDEFKQVQAALSTEPATVGAQDSGDGSRAGAHRVEGIISSVHVVEHRVKKSRYTSGSRYEYCPVYSFLSASGVQREYTDRILCEGSRTDIPVAEAVTLIYLDGSSFVFQDSARTLSALEASNSGSGVLVVLGWISIGFGVVLLILVWRPARLS